MLKIQMRGGMEFEGENPLNVVQKMRGIAIDADIRGMSDEEYMLWMSGMAGDVEGVIVLVIGSTDEEKAQMLINTMAEVGLIRILEKPRNHFLQ